MQGKCTNYECIDMLNSQHTVQTVFYILCVCLCSLQTLQMGIKHFSGLFLMLCVGLGLSLLTTLAEHIIYRFVIPRVKEPKFKYWLHTSQVTNLTITMLTGCLLVR